MAEIGGGGMLDRRRALATGLMATGATAMLPPTMANGAGEPLPGSQPPAYYRLRVGGIEAIRVHDGYAVRPLDAGFVRNAELTEIQAALAAVFQPTDEIIIPFTATVVRSPQHTVLIDAGLGDFAPPTAGQCRRNLAAAGIEPAEVNVVVISHFHADHISGLRWKDGTAAFPNATVMVPEAEWAFWMDDGQMSRAPKGMRTAFENVRRVFGPIAKEVVRFKDGTEVVPGIRAMAAPGHTPGHTVFLVSDGDNQLLVWSDTTNKPELFVRHPTWQAVFDMDGEQAVTTRLRLLDMAAAERLLVAGYHFPFPAAGHIGRSGSGYDFVPVFWHATL
jgi:glyoxylase-like metal-dependent hydrolase (beta-lactamase superfamily II)